MTDMPRILFMGTPDFAVQSLDALVGAGYEILVVTQPDRPVGRKRVLTPPPVKTAALAHGLPVLQPNRVKTPESLAELEAFQPDVLVTAAYGQLLPQRLLNLPRIGAINVHASILPRWRGAAPIHRCLMAGDEETGVTIMEMVQRLDAGPILGVMKTPISSDDSVDTLHNRLASCGAGLLIELLPQYLAGALIARPQPEDGITYAQRILRADEILDFTRPAVDVVNHIRGLSPWPGATSSADGTAIKIWSARLCDGTKVDKPGTVSVPDEGSQVAVQCGDGRIELLEVQPAGKRKMRAEDWYRGYSHKPIQLESVQL